MRAGTEQAEKRGKMDGPGEMFYTGGGSEDPAYIADGTEESPFVSQ